jgi:hypothetical protein
MQVCIIMSLKKLVSFRVHCAIPTTRIWAKDKKFWQREEAYAIARKSAKMVCNYNTCHGGRSWPRRVVPQHLIIWGRDPTLRGVQPTPIKFISIYIGQIESCLELLIILTFYVNLLMLHKHNNELYKNCTKAINIHIRNFLKNFILDIVGFTIYLMR